MKKLLAFALLFLSSPAWALTDLTIEEADGTPSVKLVRTIKVANGTLTDNTDRTVSLSASASAANVTVGTTTVTSGTVGAVLLVGSGPVLQQDATKLWWDITNDRLGIGTITPAYPLDVAGIGRFGGTTSRLTLSTGDYLGHDTTPGFVSSAGNQFNFQTNSVGIKGHNGTTQGNLKLYEDSDNGTNFVAIKAPDSVSSDVTWIWPSADGTVNQVLKTDGAGNLSWGTGGSGGGSSAQRVYLAIQQAKLPASNAAAIDASENHWRLLFDTSTSESVNWQFVAPSDYGSAPTVKIIYSMNSATSGGVAFDVAFAAITPGDAVDAQSKNYATAATVTDATVPGTAGHVDVMNTASLSAAEVDNMAAGDIVRLKISRNVGHATDTATGDCEVLGVVLNYTSA